MQQSSYPAFLVDPRGTGKSVRMRFSKVSIQQRLFCSTVVLLIMIIGVQVIHFPSTAGVYYMGKNVEVEIMSLVHIPRATKALMITDCDTSHDRRTA